MTKAYIFDLDGTLVDTERLWVKATEFFVRTYDPSYTYEQALDIVYGRSWLDVYKSVCEQLPELEMTLAEMELVMREEFVRLRDAFDVRIESSIELLRKLSASHPVCIVSGSPRHDLEHAIELMGIAENIAFFLSAEEYGPGKPDPTCFLMAADRLGVAPSECVVFEDSRAGILAAKSGGMFAVALQREGAPHQDLSAADVVLSDLAQYQDVAP